MKIFYKSALFLLKKRIFFKPVLESEFADLYYYPKLAYKIKSKLENIDIEFIIPPTFPCKITYDKNNTGKLKVFLEQGKTKTLIAETGKPKILKTNTITPDEVKKIWCANLKLKN